jgi:DNA-binding NtrC family response regulator
MAMPVKTIFVLDDDEEQAALLAQALSSSTWKVRAFSDPIRALAALNTEGADLLIADLSMPWIDGGDVVASARVRRPMLRVILVSGYARGAEIAHRYGVPFFAKPIDLAALRRTVEAGLHAPLSSNP